MSRRAWFSLVNAGLLGASLLVMFLFPQYAAYALYAIVGWIAAGLTLTWSGWTAGGTSSSPTGTPGPTLSAGPGGAVLPQATPAPPIDFCIFCGRRFEPGTVTCPECRHPLPRPAV